ncbi:MAG: [FeFe] hydrogenase H-cluster radical SAM maturase HydG [Deferribacteraceae bacterium]|jgi:2-iminoacetate synthase|nr:[FeFe] hydrogenase H-cluster radical SAM maturase HydG [Deferribacteraceae bacterium]
MYNSKSYKASDFINEEEILSALESASENKNNFALINDILAKASEHKGLDYKEVSVLLESDSPEIINELYRIAEEIKQKFYGNRIVMFAPLYLSNYCVNGCVYCPYHCSNKKMARKKLTQEEIRSEVIALQDMGHKRLALEAGEDPKNNPIEYILESIDTIYSIKNKNGSIRRVNVNVAATTAENYKALRNAGIGTYILFQETYSKRLYEKLHPFGPKSDYAYHTEAMDRAMTAGIDDVGLGVLLGLNAYKYDVAALMMHVRHLEDFIGVGPHTISMPRIRPADDICIDDFEKSASDETLKKIIAILRIAVPYTGIIISTRESQKTREELLRVGVSQISGGSLTSVGGYGGKRDKNTSQFSVNDERLLSEIIEWLIDLGHIPSFCTACYREGRTGDRFMSLVKNGEIVNVCQPNAVITLKEYLKDYASEEIRRKGEKVLTDELNGIKSQRVREKAQYYISEINNGKRDFRF